MWERLSRRVGSVHVADLFLPFAATRQAYQKYLSRATLCGHGGNSDGKGIGFLDLIKQYEGLHKIS